MYTMPNRTWVSHSAIVTLGDASLIPWITRHVVNIFEKRWQYF